MSDDRPSESSTGMQLMLAICEVNGAAIDASESDRETPMWPALSAAVSFAPSPHMPV